MSWCRVLLLVGWSALAAGQAGCGKGSPSGAEPSVAHGEHEHAHEAGDEHAGDEASAPARFIEGRGLQLAAPTAQALGLRHEPANRRMLTPRVGFAATVFDAGPPARVTAFVSAEVAEVIERHPPTTATLLAVRRDAAASRTEVVLALPGSRPVGTAVTLSVQGDARRALAVPAAAILWAATGVFVYAMDGDFLVRRPIETGASDGAWVEVTRGLEAGTAVVTSAVEELWLTELRLTKGGGHSH